MAEPGRAAPASEPDRGLERLVMLTAGVFAIALTLLAIELCLPSQKRPSPLKKGRDASVVLAVMAAT